MGVDSLFDSKLIPSFSFGSPILIFFLPLYLVLFPFPDPKTPVHWLRKPSENTQSSTGSALEAFLRTLVFLFNHNHHFWNTTASGDMPSSRHIYSEISKRMKEWVKEKGKDQDTMTVEFVRSVEFIFLRTLDPVFADCSVYAWQGIGR